MKTLHAAAFALALPALFSTGAARGAEAKPTPAPPKVAATPEATPSGPQSLKAKKEYKRGIELVGTGSNRSAEKAIPLLWFFLKRNAPETPEYERAEFHFAKALSTLGFNHAAAEYFVNVAKGRRDARLLPSAMRELEDLVKGRPFDGELILGQLVSDTDFGYLPPGVEDFVAFHQGLTDNREGYARWGSEHFADLKPDSSFYWQVKYLEGLRKLAAEDNEGARQIFEGLANVDVRDDDLKRKVNLTLARLEYESAEYPKSLARYETIQLPLQKKGPIFLERAWDLYQSGDFSKALGLLAALEAPVFKDFDDPEKYTLRALMFRDVCHFDAAHRAVLDFRKAYGPAIKDIYARADLPADETFRALALKNPDVAERAGFVDALAKEKDRLSKTPGDWKEEGLRDHLRSLYDLKLEEAKRRLDLSLDQHTEEIGDQLLEAEEQMNVLDYEIELARNRRAKTKPPQTGELVTDVPWTQEIQFYGFNGEFWNDEIEDLRVVIEDKCEGMTRSGKFDTNAPVETSR